MSLEELNKIIENAEFVFFGLRKDNLEYKEGDFCKNSHQLFQDPDFDDDGNLIYPYCSEGPYKGYYDAGELDGTCTVQIIDGNVEQALEKVKEYSGKHIYLIAGNNGVQGNDIYNQEFIISDAKVLGQL